MEYETTISTNFDRSWEHFTELLDSPMQVIASLDPVSSSSLQDFYRFTICLPWDRPWPQSGVLPAHLRLFYHAKVGLLRIWGLLCME
jgi:hypothetical protein